MYITSIHFHFVDEFVNRVLTLPKDGVKVSIIATRDFVHIVTVARGLPLSGNLKHADLKCHYSRYLMVCAGDDGNADCTTLVWLITNTVFYSFTLHMYGNSCSALGESSELTSWFPLRNTYACQDQ